MNGKDSLKKFNINWEYILIIVILILFICGGILAWQWWMAEKEIKEKAEMPEIKGSSEVHLEEMIEIQSKKPMK